MWIRKSDAELQLNTEKSTHQQVLKSAVYFAIGTFISLYAGPNSSNDFIAQHILYLAPLMGLAFAFMMEIRIRARTIHDGTSYLCPACETTSSVKPRSHEPRSCACGGEALPVTFFKWAE